MSACDMWQCLPVSDVLHVYFVIMRWRHHYSVVASAFVVLQCIYLLITETGIDGGCCAVTHACANGLNGWQEFCSAWGGDCVQQYLYQLAWYDQILRAGEIFKVLNLH